MIRGAVGAVLLVSSFGATAAEYLALPQWTVFAGESITRTVRISGIDPLLDQVTVYHYGDIDFGLDWIEDWDDGPLIWGNEYLYITDLTVYGSGFLGQSVSIASDYGPFFLFTDSVTLAVDGGDMLATISFRLGGFDQRCKLWMTQWEACGIRPFGAWLYTDLLISGPNEGRAIISVDTVPTPQVPEPATWALLIAGFGLVGATLRRRAPAIA